MRLYLILIIVSLGILIGCNLKNGPKKDKGPFLKEDTTSSTKIDIPNTFKSKNDILIDSMYISIPSEGTVVKKFKKKNDTFLYVSNSFGTMSSVYYEILITNQDSMFVLKRMEEYNKPLTMEGAQLINKEREYMVFANSRPKLYAKNDTIFTKMKNSKNKFEEVKRIINKINLKGKN